MARVCCAVKCVVQLSLSLVVLVTVGPMCGVAPTAVLQCCECAAVAQAGYCRTTAVKQLPSACQTMVLCRSSKPAHYHGGGLGCMAQGPIPLHCTHFTFITIIWFV
jgi:hypothetical protein